MIKSLCRKKIPITFSQGCIYFTSHDENNSYVSCGWATVCFTRIISSYLENDVLSLDQYWFFIPTIEMISAKNVVKIHTIVYEKMLLHLSFTKTVSASPGHQQP